MAEFHQQPLFGPDPIPPHADHRRRPPIAAAADPETSHRAGKQLTDSGERDRQVEQVAAAVRAHPGLTSLELAERIGEDRHMIAKRLPDAAARNLVRKGEPHMQANGRPGVSWHPVMEGES